MEALNFIELIQNKNNVVRSLEFSSQKFELEKLTKIFKNTTIDERMDNEDDEFQTPVSFIISGDYFQFDLSNDDYQIGFIDGNEFITTICLPMPETIDDFIRDCQRQNITLYFTYEISSLFS